MGTNYYLEIDNCGTCHRSASRVHIGKSSCGWRFALHCDTTTPWTDYDGFAEFIIKNVDQKKTKLVDEYGSELSVNELFTRILGAKNDTKRPSDIRVTHHRYVDVCHYEFC